MATRASSGPKRRLAEYRRKRDFSKTREPSGSKARGRERGPLHFVIQKHAASHLHFDFRLELDGVMKSWAVPKGPSLDPSVKRLAMEVEDHPIEYNTFEGTIPQGEYGGGTVMLWDRGTYTADDAGADPVDALRRGYERGDLKFVLEGERLRGSWVLVRTRRGESKPQWLLIKHRDEYADPGSEVTAEYVTSVATGRTMDEIAEGKSKVWHSNRAARKRKTTAVASPAPKTTRSAAPRRGSAKPPPTIEPMLASIGTDVPRSEGWTFEPKYDGIRIIAYATSRSARLITRNGKDKTAQFPEIADAARKLAAQSRRSLVLDGEVVALEHGRPARFQELQQRMHVKDSAAIEEFERATPAAYFVFDLLMDGEEVLLDEPWTERRKRLELRLRNRTSERVRLSESAPGDGNEMLAKARADGWEGIIAKRTDSRYQPGHRSREWLKLKVEYRQEFVVGGWTEPRRTRPYFGALLLGYYDRGRFIYAGNMGGGFDRKSLEAMYERLQPLERKTSPFEETPRTGEPVHWVTPRIVVEVKFSEWTADGKLRQPIYVGTRDDKDPRDVTREAVSVQEKRPAAGRARSPRRGAAAREKTTRKHAARKTAARKRARSRSGGGAGDEVVRQLDEIERSGGAGTLELPGGAALDVTSLDKVFFPAERYTKGDVMRYYARVSSVILPVMADRPLVLKRSPDGIEGETFFQQRASDHTPESVRVETVETADGEPQMRLVGGDLATLLYTVQIGCISVDPWHSRVGSPHAADYTILDLDPGPRAGFSRIVQVARWVREELDALRLRAALKTSGSRGLHVVLPLPPATAYDAALLLSQLVATRVAAKHPREATVERSVKARPPATVYVDYLQNVEGKSVAAAYCVRAKPGATVSTPLGWDELDERLDPRDFTIESVPARLATLGDVWGAALRRRNTAAAIRAAANQ